MGSKYNTILVQSAKRIGERGENHRVMGSHLVAEEVEQERHDEVSPADNDDRSNLRIEIENEIGRAVPRDTHTVQRKRLLPTTS